MSKNVLVVVERRDGILRNVSFEVLTAAQQMTNGGEVIAVVFGQGNQDEAQQLAQHGADKVYIATNEELNAYSTDAFSQALTEVVQYG